MNNIYLAYVIHDDNRWCLWWLETAETISILASKRTKPSRRPVLDKCSCSRNHKLKT